MSDFYSITIAALFSRSVFVFPMHAFVNMSSLSWYWLRRIKQHENRIILSSSYCFDIPNVYMKISCHLLHSLGELSVFDLTEWINKC